MAIRGVDIAAETIGIRLLGVALMPEGFDRVRRV
jgi:hypothetical protein